MWRSRGRHHFDVIVTKTTWIHCRHVAAQDGRNLHTICINIWLAYHATGTTSLIEKIYISKIGVFLAVRSWRWIVIWLGSRFIFSVNMGPHHVGFLFLFHSQVCESRSIMDLPSFHQSRIQLCESLGKQLTMSWSLRRLMRQPLSTSASVTFLSVFEFPAWLNTSCDSLVIMDWPWPVLWADFLSICHTEGSYYCVRRRSNFLYLPAFIRAFCFAARPAKKVSSQRKIDNR